MTSHQEKPEGSESLAAETASTTGAQTTAAVPAESPSSEVASPPRRAARAPRRKSDDAPDAAAPSRKRRSRRTADESAAETASAAQTGTEVPSPSGAESAAVAKATPARRSRRTGTARAAAVEAAEAEPASAAENLVAPAAAEHEEKSSPARKTRSAARGRTSRKTAQTASSAPSESAGQEADGQQAQAAPAAEEASPTAALHAEEAAAPRRTVRAGRGRKKAAAEAEQTAQIAETREQTAGAGQPSGADTDAAGEEGGEASAPAPRKATARGRKRNSAAEAAAAPVQEAATEVLPALEQQELLPPAVQEKSCVPVLREQALPVPLPAPAATAEPEPTDESAEPAAPAAAEEDGSRRKSRRGRRGGRGRNRKNRQNGETAESPALTEARAGEVGSAASPSPVAEEDAAAEGESAEPAKKGSVRAAAVKARAASSTGRQRMFISILPGEQVEVALAEEGVLLEYYLDMLHQKKLKGNIYKGVIHNIDTNLQAAFVSYGAGKNGFLQIDEVHPEYWLTHHEPARGKKYPPIQKVLKAGQEVLVQVVKEPNGSKGAFLTTWLSLAGRFLVLTPGQEQIGVSRKVDNDEERARLREMMSGIDPGEGLGVIVRTVSAGVTKTTLRSDLQYLKRVWKDIRKKATEVTAPALIHEEPGLPERAVRDYLTDDVCEIWVDNEALAESIRDTVSQLFPRKKDLVRLHSDTRHTLWERFNLRRQLDQIYSREVTLPSGGRLVFDQTEALMAVDINSGKISGKVNFESMAFKTNVEAAETIARQLKLRDIGGQVVIDFIEMRDRKHVLEVEKTLRTAMKNDRARHDVGRMSSFGLLELVRQRMGSSALAISMEPCPHCNGTGQRRNREWQALQALRELRCLLRSCQEERLRFETTAEVGMYLLNHKRDTLRDMENSFGKSIEICLRP